MTLVVCMLYGATFLSNLTPVLFVLLYDLSSWLYLVVTPNIIIKVEFINIFGPNERFVLLTAWDEVRRMQPTVN